MGGGGGRDHNYFLETVPFGEKVGDMAFASPVALHQQQSPKTNKFRRGTQSSIYFTPNVLNSINMFLVLYGYINTHSMPINIIYTMASLHPDTS